MMHDLDLSLCAVPHIRWRCYEQGGILLNTLTGEVYRLNESGMFMWQLLTEGYSPRATISAIVQKTGAETSLVKANVEGFIASMLKQGALCASEAVDGTDSERVAVAGLTSDMVPET